MGQMAVLAVGGGVAMISACPGRGGDATGDVAAWLAWGPDLVVSMATLAEMAGAGVDDLEARLRGAGVAWVHCPVPDYGVPDGRWGAVEAAVGPVLARGGRVVVHCMAGCGRSGAAVLRLMIGAGETPDAALSRLRAVRPCAVETAAQAEWARQGAG